MAGNRRVAALAAGILAAALSGTAVAQYYYPSPPRYYPAPRYQPDPGYGYGGYYEPRRARGAISRVCATDQGTVCYGDWQRVGEWCKCGRRETRATGSIVPEE